MCDPTAIAIGSLVVGVVGSIEKSKAQNDAAAANKANAQASYENLLKQVDVQEGSQITAATTTIFEADRSARATKALASVSAGEAGVAGTSVEALLGDIDRKRAEFGTQTNRNLHDALDQLQAEKVSGQLTETQRESAVPGANPFAEGISIAGQALGFAAGQVARGKTKTVPLGDGN